MSDGIEFFAASFATGERGFDAPADTPPLCAEERAERWIAPGIAAAETAPVMAAARFGTA